MQEDKDFLEEIDERKQQFYDSIEEALRANRVKWGTILIGLGLVVVMAGLYWLITKTPLI